MPTGNMLFAPLRFCVHSLLQVAETRQLKEEEEVFLLNAVQTMQVRACGKALVLVYFIAQAVQTLMVRC